MSYSEEDIKTQIEKRFFPRGKYAIYKNRLDFAVEDKARNPIFWAESKRGTSVSKWLMLAQLILTIKPRLDSGEMPPAFIGCFDAQEITFCEFFHVQKVLTTNDFNWNEKPSAVSIKSAEKVRALLENDVFTFNWIQDANAVKEFIQNNFVVRGLFDGQSLLQYISITKNNFIQIFNRWQKQVLPSIAIPKGFFEHGLIAGDFFLADIMADDKNKTISRKLNILLNHTEYKVSVKIQNMDLFREIKFRDNGKAHKRFWGYYIRPPKEEYRNYICERRDLLVPSGIRERQGAFFTPEIWVRKSQEYIEKVFGKDWQDEYYVWDCCAGTGNLLDGLVNPERVWASTLDKPDVMVMKENKRLLQDHCFQFDFLNDGFEKLPKKLYNLLLDTPEKVIIYINPPYGECGHEKEGKNKEGISTENKMYEEFAYLGRGLRDIATLFMARIKRDVPRCKLCIFNKLKYITAPNLTKFREMFGAEYLGGFVVLAETFDNVKGKFPIGFMIWDIDSDKRIESVACDVLGHNKDLTESKNIGQKTFFSVDDDTWLINDWLDMFQSTQPPIAYMNCKSNDFQHNKNICLVSTIKQTSLGDKVFAVTPENLLESAVYFSTRHCIEANWLNDRDLFLYPKDTWKQDEDFKTDCLVYMLFSSQNVICSAFAKNHFIPFKPTEVHADVDFDSDFMRIYMGERTQMSKYAKRVYNAALELWRFYQLEIKGGCADVNASLYEIREYFRGRTEKGRLRVKSENIEFQKLDDALKLAIDDLAKNIALKVYKYGFLKK